MRTARDRVSCRERIGRLARRAEPTLLLAGCAAGIVLLTGCGRPPVQPLEPCASFEPREIPPPMDRPLSPWAIAPAQPPAVFCQPGAGVGEAADALPPTQAGVRSWEPVVPAGCAAAYFDLEAELTVDRCGKPTSVCLSRGDGGAIDAAVATHLLGARFEPAMLRGQPVPTVVTLFPLRLMLAERAGLRTSREELNGVDEIDDIQRLLDDRSTSAYVRLGKLGTPASLAAVRAIEARAREGTGNPAPDRVGWGRTSTSAPDGTVYTVTLGSDRDLDSLYLFIDQPGNHRPPMSRHVLLPIAPHGTPAEWRLRFAGPGRLVLTMPTYSGPPSGTGNVRPVDYSLSLSDATRDSDADGETDVAERRMGLDPTNPDTDGDGRLDGVDPWPDLAGPPAGPPSADEIILQRAVYAAIGQDGPGAMIIAHPSVRPIQLLGHYGPILYKPSTYEAAKADYRPARFLAWRIVCRSGADAATVVVSRGGMQSYDDTRDTWEVQVARRGTEWVAVRAAFSNF
jgi:hypothetical protein